MGPEHSLLGAEAAGLRGRYELECSFLLPRYRDPCGQCTCTQSRLSRQQLAMFHIHVQTGPFNLLTYLSMST